MLSLTGRPLLVLTIVCAVGSIAGLVLIVLRATGSAPAPRGRRRATYLVGTAVLALLGPACTVLATGLVRPAPGAAVPGADVPAGPAELAAGDLPALQLRKPRLATDPHPRGAVVRRGLPDPDARAAA